MGNPGMAKSGTKGKVKPKQRRLPSDERRGTILAAARKVFSQSGDPTGTTMKSIANAAGMREGSSYRHSESKEQLYFESIVQPPTDTISGYLHEASSLDRFPFADTANA